MRFGVRIPDDVVFVLDEIGDLNANCLARGPRVRHLPGSVVRLSDLVHDRTGKITFRVWPEIMKSDEAIAAVFAHEVHEIETLRPYLEAGKMTIEGYFNETRPDNEGNVHYEAWDIADKMVEQMRKELAS